MIRKTWLLAFLLIYIVGYAVFRQVNSEIWAKDNQTYVIYPDTTLGRAGYTFWRPLAYADNAMTGRRSHIGPHR